MSGDLLEFPSDDLEIEPEPEIALEIEPEPSVPVVPAALVPALVEILPADFPLPALIKFVPNAALRAAVDDAATYALRLTVEGADGLQRADVALTALRGSLKAITEHFEEPTRIAYDLHKRLTGIRGEWTASGDAAVKAVGQRVFAEQRRLEQLATEARRKAQDEANARAREEAKQAAAEAAKNQAPASVVEEMTRQAETATAPPVAAPTPAPVMRGSTTVTTWKARIVGTPASDEPNPEIEQLTPAQRAKVLTLLAAIVDGKAPLAAVEVNWPYLNKRAKADKGTLAIVGIEAYEEGGVRAKGSRSR
jgi:ribosome assembly protein YihI (activator of Der GTPase)